MKNDEVTNILHAYRIEGDGRGSVIADGDIAQSIKDKDLAWVHLDARDHASRQWLQKEITYLDPIIIDALLADETRPRILEFENGVLMILRGVNLNEGAEPEDMVSLRLWIDEDRIISTQRRHLKAIKDIEESLQAGRGPKNSGEFIAVLTARMFEHMEVVFDELDETLDVLEERVIDNPDTKDRQGITNIRKQAIVFRRYILPQRDVIAHLRISELPWLEQIHKRRLQEVMDTVIRYIEDLDTLRERAQIVKEELANTLTDRMNKNMYVLSVIASIFLPLSFLTGLFGINLAGIPGAESHYAFAVFCVLLAGIIFAQIILFKKMKWF